MRTETQREDGVARRLRAPHAHLAAVRSRNPHFSPSYSSALCWGPPARAQPPLSVSEIFAPVAGDFRGPWTTGRGLVHRSGWQEHIPPDA